MDCSPSGSSVPGILQARILEQCAIFYSRGSSECRDETFISCIFCIGRGFLGDSDGKESACKVGDLGLILGSGILPGEGNGYPFQCSCPENSMDRGDWQTIVHGVTESRTRLSNVHFHFPTISATLGAGINHYSLSKSRVPSKSTSLLQLDRAIRLFLANVLWK